MSELSVDDVSVWEGDSGSVEAGFTVTLAPPCMQPVTDHWATRDLTATAPADYGAGSDDLGFAPGQTTGTVAIPVNGDRFDELDENFLLELSSPTAAIIAEGEATGTIVDDDPMPNLSATGVEVCEGMTAWVSFRLDTPSGFEVSVDYQTVAGTATAGADFVVDSGTFTLPGSTCCGSVPVVLLDDLLLDGVENLTLDLSDRVNCTLQTTAVGVTIVDDEQVGRAFADGFESGDTSAWSDASPGLQVQGDDGPPARRAVLESASRESFAQPTPRAQARSSRSRDPS